MPTVRLSHVVHLRICSVISIAYDHIIYDIFDERVTVLIIQAEQHYNDK